MFLKFINVVTLSLFVLIIFPQKTVKRQYHKQSYKLMGGAGNARRTDYIHGQAHLS